MLLILHERKKKEKEEKKTIVHPFTPVSHDNSTRRHFRNGERFERRIRRIETLDRFSFFLFILFSRGIVKISVSSTSISKDRSLLGAFNRETFDVFLKRCQKRNRLNISILGPRDRRGDARQSSCQFFQRTNIRLDVFDKGWLIHPD